MVSFDRDDFVLDSLAQVDFPLFPRNPVLLGGGGAGSRPVRFTSIGCRTDNLATQQSAVRSSSARTFAAESPYRSRFY
jgi:hypothetical protein